VGLGQGTLESLAMSQGFWRGKSVFVTGHTGFKGGWLALWLSTLGARVHGYALQAATEPNLFEVADIAGVLSSHTLGDVRDAGHLSRSLHRAQPDIVLHLAAQPLVRYSYRQPVETYATNVMGTVHLLDAVRSCESVRAVVNVTTDKCYVIKEWAWGYRESDQLGGHDPYASSKACSELITASFRDSYFAASGVAVATARAGNVIGGGDWSGDRIVPDFLRAADSGRVLEVRSPAAIRPWQHVLEPLGGYLMLAERLHSAGQPAAQAWNFGPVDDDARPVGELLDMLSAALPGARWRAQGGDHPHEAAYLKLDSSKARSELRWRPRWDLAHAVARTVEWHSAWRGGEDMQAYSREQIAEHQGRMPVAA